MTDVNRIIEKVTEPEDEPKRSGVWEIVEQFEDKQSCLGIEIRQRIRGRPAYSYTLLFFDKDRGSTRYLPHHLPKSARPPEEVVYLLIKRAREFVEERLAKERPRKTRKPKDKKRTR